MDMAYLLWLQELRLSAPLWVQAFISFLGSEAAMVIAMVPPCVIYWCLNRELGTFALLAYGSSSLCNQFIKNTACVYRPWVRDVRIVPDPTALKGAGGYSFPSGHTQSATSMLFGLTWPSQNKAYIALALAFSALIGLSRNILGVHTPQDVIVGLLEGCVFVLLTAWVLPWIEEREGRDTRVLVVGALVTVAFLVFTTVKPYPYNYDDGKLLVDPADMLVDCYKAAGTFLGILAGWYVERRFVHFKTGGLSRTEGLLRVVVGLLVALVTYVFIGHLFVVVTGEYAGQLLRHVLCFFAMVAVVPALFAPLHTWMIARAARREA